MSGHLVIAAFVGLVFMARESSHALGYGVELSVIIGGILLTLLELFICFLQAFIFTFLTVLFISMVATHHDHHDHEEDHDPFSDEDQMDMDKLIDPSRMRPMSRTRIVTYFDPFPLRGLSLRNGPDQTHERFFRSEPKMFEFAMLLAQAANELRQDGRRYWHGLGDHWCRHRHRSNRRIGSRRDRSTARSQRYHRNQHVDRGGLVEGISVISLILMLIL